MFEVEFNSFHHSRFKERFAESVGFFLSSMDNFDEICTIMHGYNKENHTINKQILFTFVFLLLQQLSCTAHQVHLTIDVTYGVTIL